MDGKANQANCGSIGVAAYGQGQQLNDSVRASVGAAAGQLGNTPTPPVLAQIEELRQQVRLWRARANDERTRADALQEHVREWQGLATDSADDLAVKRAEFEITLADVRSARDASSERAADTLRLLSIANRMLRHLTGRAVPITPYELEKIISSAPPLNGTVTECDALRQQVRQYEITIDQLSKSGFHARGEIERLNAEVVKHTDKVIRTQKLLDHANCTIRTLSENLEGERRISGWRSCWVEQLRSELSRQGTLSRTFEPKGAGYMAYVEFNRDGKSAKSYEGNVNSALTGNHEASNLEKPRRQTPWAHKAGSLAEMVREAMFSPWSSHQQKRIGELFTEIENETSAHCRSFFEENWK